MKRNRTGRVTKQFGNVLIGDGHRHAGRLHSTDSCSQEKQSFAPLARLRSLTTLADNRCSLRLWAASVVSVLSVTCHAAAHSNLR